MSHSNYMSISEAYSSIYEDTTQQDFLELVDQLVEEGYDLSDYTYDELYEGYLSEGGLGSILKGAVPILKNLAGRTYRAGRGAARTAWQGTTKATPKGDKVIPGAKETTKQMLAKVGSVAPWVALGLGLDQYLTGGRGRESIGSGIETIRNLASGTQSLPSPPTAAPSTPPQKKVRNPLVISGGEVQSGGTYKESYDLFDIIKDHLISEGYADTDDEAVAIMSSMSEEWKQYIIETFAHPDVVQRTIIKNTPKPTPQKPPKKPGQPGPLRRPDGLIY